MAGSMSERDYERCGLDLSKLTVLKFHGYEVVKSHVWTILQYHGQAIATFYPDIKTSGAWNLYIRITPSFSFHLDTLRKILGTVDGVV